MLNLKYLIMENLIWSTFPQTEMMSDTIDDALDNDEAEEEIEDLTNQVGGLSEVVDLALCLPLSLHGVSTSEFLGRCWMKSVLMLLHRFRILYLVPFSKFVYAFGKNKICMN